MRARDQIINQSAPRQRQPRTSRNTFVDGKGGELYNILDESFQCEFDLESMGRQARAIPQNWEARCPGSLRTNWENPHLRAGVTQPTSAEAFEIGSRPDHPRSYMNHCRRIPRRLGQALVVTWKLRGKIFQENNHDDSGFYFGSRKISAEIVDFVMVAERG